MDYRYAMQQELFPQLERKLGLMDEHCELLVKVPELVHIKALLPCIHGLGTHNCLGLRWMEAR